MSTQNSAAERYERVQVVINSNPEEQQAGDNRMTRFDEQQDNDGNNSPGELGSPGKSYNSIPTQELPQSPSKRSTMFEKRKAQDISWEDLNFTVNKEIHVLRHVWGNEPCFSFYLTTYS
jgi:hypothetical protein